MYLKKLKNFLLEIKQEIKSISNFSRLNNELIQKGNLIAGENAANLAKAFLSTPPPESLTTQLSLDFYRTERLAQIAQKTPDCPVLHGYKFFSQCDEDGIIHHILSALAEKSELTRTFIEFGCGDGLENNTHALLLEGYTGCWIEGNPDLNRYVMENIGASSILKVIPQYVTLENLPAIIAECTVFLGTKNIDFFSMDLDGNDYHFVKNILEEISPKLICVEYNGNFPPHVNMQISYNAPHKWQGNDYYGASLRAWVDLLTGYKLVSCNLSGVNAFFVRNDFAAEFADYSVEELFQQPRYEFRHLQAGHPVTFEWLKELIKKREEKI